MSNPLIREETPEERAARLKKKQEIEQAKLAKKASRARSRDAVNASAPDDGSAVKKTAKKRKPKKVKQPKVYKHPALHKAFKAIFIALLSLCMVGILTVLAVGGYVFTYIDRQATGEALVDLQLYREDQSQTSIVYAYDKKHNLVELARLHGEINRIWVDYEQIPENLRNAYIALEDQRFWSHRGVDWYRTIGVVLEARLQQGGSTITQQLIKNLTGENGRTFSRKFNEIIRALNLERHYSKETILETYLNTLYLDAGCYGVETAAEYYFGKNVSELDLAECASIAAITKAPYTYDPMRNYDKNLQRRQLCLNDMLEQGLITQEEHDEAYFKELNLVGNQKAVDDANSTSKDTTSDIQSYYVDYVIDQVISDLKEQYDMSSSEAWRKVYYGGLKIYTCEDMEIQSIMEDIYYNRTGMTGDDPDLQSAMAVVDYSGRLMGIVGQAGEKTTNRGLNIAADSPRQPGSSIKPLSVYAPGVDSGELYWSSMLMNYGIELPNGKIWPENYGGDPGDGNYYNLQQAIAPSMNTIPARIVKLLGIDFCYKYLTEHFHLNHLVDEDRDYSPIAVGGMNYGVTCVEMASAYASFGNGGKYFRASTYDLVTNADDSKVWLSRDEEGEQAVEPGTADVIQELMRTVVTSSNGTARKWKLDDMQMIAKTGTTTDNKDSWFIGGTPYYMGAVWYGYSKNPQELHNIGGNSPSGRMWYNVMSRVHEDLENKDFYKSEDSVKLYYCTGSGMRASSGCASTASGWFRKDSIPKYCDGCYVHGASGQGPTITTDTTIDPSAVSESQVTDITETPPVTDPPVEVPATVAPTTTPPTAPPTTAPPTTTAAPSIVVPDEDDR
ncbi:MAG: transglycosylase domain-containing protein [Clostridiales bacterium]|nr:transglycosylase domain-containing protein [Clostridiales bacterium]